MRSEVVVAHSLSSGRHQVTDGSPVHPAGPPHPCLVLLSTLAHIFSYYNIRFSLFVAFGFRGNNLALVRDAPRGTGP